MKPLLLFFSIFFSHQIAANSPAWIVQPNICIAEKIGDKCQMLLQLSVTHLPKSKHCLWLNNQKLECYRASSFTSTVPISIRQASLLSLKNMQQQTLLSQNLSIKYLQTQHIRRRIREPWSLF